jgi:hypothetical protein
MRTFLFPRRTVTLLVLALVITLAGIDKVGMARWAFLQLVLAGTLFVCVLGVIVFVLRAALERTCIQRWTVAKTWPAQDAPDR